MKKIAYLLLILVLTVICIPVNAKDNFYANQELNLNKEYDSTVFAAGNNVKATGRVDGISFIAGNNISVENERDYLFAAGNVINIKNVTTKDAFVAGSNITIEDSIIRDLYAAGEKITIDSDIDGKAYVGGEEVTINSTIKGDIKVSAERIILGEKANIEGTLKYPEDAKISKEKDTKIAKEKTYKVKSASTKEKAMEMFIDFLSTVSSMILIGLLLLSLNRKVFDKIEKVEKTAASVFKMTLLGFAVLVLVPILSVILISSTIGIGLGVICLLMYGIMFYLSVLPTAYFLGNWIAQDKMDNKYLLFTISILAIYVLRLIPIIGGLVTIISLCFGLGVYAKLIKENSSIK